MSLVVKDPASVIDFGFDWADQIDEGVILMDSQWFVHPVEPEGLATMTTAQNGLETTSYVTGGITGHRYLLTCRVTTSDARIMDRSLTIRIEER